jgi:hypothetical protein
MNGDVDGGVEPALNCGRRLGAEASPSKVNCSGIGPVGLGVRFGVPAGGDGAANGARAGGFGAGPGWCGTAGVSSSPAPGATKSAAGGCAARCVALRGVSCSMSSERNSYS